MLSNSASRRLLSGLVLVAVLFAQLATAAYACPALMRPGNGADMASMPCAEMMAGALTVDADQPGLCFEHCQADAGQPPLDPAQFMVLQAPVLLQMFSRAPVAEASVIGASTWAAHARERERAPPEPHSIHHCCYRL